jgi:hypothetical protein
MYQRALERFRTRHRSHPSAELLDRKLFLPLAEMLRDKEPDPDSVAKLIPKDRLANVSYADLVFKAHVRSTMEIVAREAGMRMDGDSCGFSYDGKEIPVLVAASTRKIKGAMDKCLEAESRFGSPVYFCTIRCRDESPLISAETIEGRFDLRLITVPHPERFEELGRALEGPKRVEADDSFDDMVYLPLVRFLAQDHAPSREFLELTMMMARQAYGNDMDYGNYAGFALESHMRSRLADFEAENAYFSVCRLRAGAMPDGTIFRGEGDGRVIFLNPSNEGRKEKAEVDAIGEIDFGGKMTPVVFEIKAKPFNKLRPEKKDRTVWKNRARARIVGRLFCSEPQICLINPGNPFMRKMRDFRIISVPGLEWIGEIARTL